MRDRLTYTWDFGDAGTATGQQVRHTFKEDGHYAVAMTVNDGDGGEDRQTLSVIVGEGYALTVEGEASGRQEGRIRFRGLPLEIPGVAAQTGTCAVEIRFESPPGRGQGPIGITFALNAYADGGLRTGRYAVAPTVPAASEVELFLVTPQGKRRILTNSAPQPDIFHAGLSLGQGVAVHYRHSDTAAIEPSAQSPRQYGIVSIDHVDSNRIEGTFNIRVEVPYRVVPRGPEVGTWYREETAHMTVTGFETGTLLRTGLRDNVNYCDPARVGTFDIASRTPVTDAQNVNTQNPPLQITFTRPVDPATIAGRVRLEYGAPAGLTEAGRPDASELSRGAGTWELVPGDDHSIRFVPQAHLLDGVIHCVRVRTGRDGLHGRRGEILDAAEPQFDARNRLACDGNRPWPGAREWAFSTLVELQGVTLGVYQVSLVPRWLLTSLPACGWCRASRVSRASPISTSTWKASGPGGSPCHASAASGANATDVSGRPAASSNSSCRGPPEPARGGGRPPAAQLLGAARCGRRQGGRSRRPRRRGPPGRTIHGAGAWRRTSPGASSRRQFPGCRPLRVAVGPTRVSPTCRMLDVQHTRTVRTTARMSATGTMSHNASSSPAQS